jgi:hypothetical protein
VCRRAVGPCRSGNGAEGVVPQEEHTVDASVSEADEGRGQATKRLGERRARDDPRVSEWGNPAGVIPRHRQLNT